MYGFEAVWSFWFNGSALGFFVCFFCLFCWLRVFVFWVLFLVLVVFRVLFGLVFCWFVGVFLLIS